jgi:hypothetical protein
VNYRGQILTGARTRLSLDGVKVALAMECSFGEEIPHEPIEPLDQFDVAEHVPIAYRVNFGAQMVRVGGSPIKNRDGVIIMPKLEEILTRGELTGTVEDPSTGRVIANIQRVRTTGYNCRVGARAVILTDVQFVAIRVKDESEIV